MAVSTQIGMIINAQNQIVCICIIVCVFFFFGHISSCSHLCPKRRMGWAQFDRPAHVAGGLGAIRAICRAWQAFYTCFALGTLEANPRVSATSPGFGFLHPLSIPVYARKDANRVFLLVEGTRRRISLFLHRSPRFDPAAQQQCSPLAAACNSLGMWRLL